MYDSNPADDTDHDRENTRKATSPAWVTRWGDVIAAKASLPGVWRRRDGGFRVRGRITDPRTGKRCEVCRALPDCRKPREAARILDDALQTLREGSTTSATAIPQFRAWAEEVLERKTKTGAFASASGLNKFKWALTAHLDPAFGDYLVDKITREQIERWKAHELLAERATTKDKKRTRRLKAKRYAPSTANTILQVLRQIMGEASDAFNIANPCRRVEDVDTRTHRTYTYEAPNALKPSDVPRFLDEMRIKFPQHYALVFLGFTTGLRPSSLRPLRALGPHADVKWDEGKLLVRRSHSYKQVVMDATKTARDQVIALDPEQISVLRWHVARLDADNVRRAKRYPKAHAAMAATELLFPAEPNSRNSGGGFRATSALDKSFAEVGKAIGLTYAVSPRAMRRTYQDLAREAKMADIVTRAISGHATETMQRHYSTVSDTEIRAGLAAVVDIATGRKRAA